MKSKLLSILAALAVLISLSACRADDRGQENQSIDINIADEIILQSSATNVSLLTSNTEILTTTSEDEKSEALKSEYDNKLFIYDNEITNDDIKEISLQSNIQELTIYFYDKNSQIELSLKSLSDLSGLKTLRLGGYCDDLSIINGMKSLEKVEIIENFGIVNLDGLGYNENVKELIISSALIENIDNIIQLPNLEKLTIENIESSKYINLSCIGELNKLDTIYLKWLNIDSIGFVEKLNNLQKFFIWSNNFNVQDYENIKECTKLEDLCIYNVDLENLEFLSALSSLVNLELRWGNIVDISPLTQIRSLRKLELWGIPYSEHLCEMDFLNELIIYETELTSEQIDNLKRKLQNCTIMY